jgi:hypothetical protein
MSWFVDDDRAPAAVSGKTFQVAPEGFVPWCFQPEVDLVFLQTSFYDHVGRVQAQESSKLGSDATEEVPNLGLAQPHTDRAFIGPVSPLRTKPEVLSEVEVRALLPMDKPASTGDSLMTSRQVPHVEIGLELWTSSARIPARHVTAPCCEAASISRRIW